MQPSRNEIIKELEKAKRNALALERSGNTNTVHHDIVKRLEKILAGGSKRSKKDKKEVKENGR